MKVEFAEVEQKPAELKGGLVAERAEPPGRWGLHSQQYLDGYFDRIRKLVPLETLLAYIVSTNLLEGESYFQGSFRWAILAFWLAATPVFYIREVGVAQAIVLTLSFISVSFALGEPFSSLSWYAPGTGAVVLVLTVLLSPLMFSLIAEPSRR